MPITAKLSRRFYEQFGDDVVNELVNLLNTVDANSRSDLRELNELNFARFDAKVEQRFAESDARFERRFAEQEVKFEKRFAEFDVKLEKQFAAFRVELYSVKSELIKWIVGLLSGGALLNYLLR